MSFCCGFRTVRSGARASAWEVLLDSERRGLGRCKRLQAKASLYLFTVVSEIKTFPAAKQRRGLNNGVRTILQVCCFRFAAF